MNNPVEAKDVEVGIEAEDVEVGIEAEDVEEDMIVDSKAAPKVVAPRSLVVAAAFADGAVQTG